MEQHQIKCKSFLEWMYYIKSIYYHELEAKIVEQKSNINN
jgi:hypothetical protein